MLLLNTYYFNILTSNRGNLSLQVNSTSIKWRESQVASNFNVTERVSYMLNVGIVYYHSEPFQ